MLQGFIASVLDGMPLVGYLRFQRVLKTCMAHADITALCLFFASAYAQGILASMLQFMLKDAIALTNLELIEKRIAALPFPSVYGKPPCLASAGRIGR